MISQAWRCKDEGEIACRECEHGHECVEDALGVVLFQALELPHEKLYTLV